LILNCDRIRENLNAYIDGELSEVEARLIADHLASCTGCAGEERMYRLARDLAVKYGHDTAPEGFAAAVRAKIEADRFPEKRTRAVPRWAALAASFVLVLLAGAYFKFFYVSIDKGMQASAPSVPVVKAEDIRPNLASKMAAVPEQNKNAETGIHKLQSTGTEGIVKASTGIHAPSEPYESDRVTPEPNVFPTKSYVMDDYQAATPEAKDVSEAIDEREKMAASAEEPAGVAKSQTMMLADSGGGSRTAVSNNSAGMKSGRVETVALGGAYGENNFAAGNANLESFLVGNLRALRPGEETEGHAVDNGAVYVADLPGRGPVIYSFNGDGASGFPAGQNVAHAADTFVVDSPSDAVKGCQTIISERAGSGAPAVQWQQAGYRIAIRGSFGALRALRLDIMREFSPADVKNFADREEKSLFAGKDASGKSFYKISDNMPAMLEINFVGKSGTTPAAPPK
jgi:hypothetical protein